MKRTLLPLNALRVFDAAARHLSFTKAADELAVTPAAVGQQIRALEEYLGVILFHRTGRSMSLTAEAEAALPALRAGFIRLEEAVDVMQAAQSASTLSFAAPPALAAGWLTAVLARYQQAAPDRIVRLFADRDEPDFDAENLDAAMILADAVPEGLEGAAIALDRAVCVCAALVQPDRLALVQDRSALARLAGLDDLAGTDGGDQPGLVVHQHAFALAAALQGSGRVWTLARLVLPDLASGRLMLCDAAPGPLLARYFLVAPPPQWSQKKVRLLREWLAGAIDSRVPDVPGAQPVAA